MNPLTSVFDAMWWFILVVTKGDVGDMQPMSPVGRFFGIVTSLIDILITGFIVSAFNESWIQLDKDRRQDLRVENNVTSTHEDHLAFLHVHYRATMTLVLLPNQQVKAHDRTLLCRILTTPD